MFFCYDRKQEVFLDPDKSFLLPGLMTELQTGAGGCIRAAVRVSILSEE
jgi:hypothetical protein